MTADSKIEWTDHTFNPWWGCVKVSPGCKHCYAEGVAERFRGDENIWGPAATTSRSPMSDAYWRNPAKWNRKAEAAGTPAFVFCASMADVFEDHPDVAPWRERLWELIADTPWLTWQLLTKRPENVADMVPRLWTRAKRDCIDGWPPNVWIGTSVEDQQRASERIPVLLDIPAPVRFLSVEPMLGPVHLTGWTQARWQCSGCRRFYTGPHLNRCPGCSRVGYWSGSVPRIGWVIAGGESGPSARPMQPAWVRDLRDDCADADVPFFFKQWGKWVDIWDQAPADTFAMVDAAHNMAGNPQRMWPVGKKAAGRLLDERTHDDRPAPHTPRAVPA